MGRDVTARTVAELLRARRVAHVYRDYASSIDEVVTDRLAKTMPITVRVLRKYASIARRAAVAEEFDPEPEWLT